MTGALSLPGGGNRRSSWFMNVRYIVGIILLAVIIYLVVVYF